MKRVVLIFALMVAVLPLAAQNGGSILGKYRKALIIGAHPDDPEYCCGGTALMLQRTGCEVVNVYLTGGEAGIPGKSGDEAKAIRQKEISDACALWVCAMCNSRRWMARAKSPRSATPK